MAPQTKLRRLFPGTILYLTSLSQRSSPVSSLKKDLSIRSFCPAVLPGTDLSTRPFHQNAPTPVHSDSVSCLKKQNKNSLQAKSQPTCPHVHSTASYKQTKTTHCHPAVLSVKYRFSTPEVMQLIDSIQFCTVSCCSLFTTPETCFTSNIVSTTKGNI